jgi:hypothetical protein
MKRVAFALLLIVASVTVADAAPWCVPVAFPGVRCPNVAPTLQQAIDGATEGSRITVGPGTPAERLVIPKRLIIEGLPGNRLHDEGLPLGGTLITITGTMDRGPRLESLNIDVTTSDIGVSVGPGILFMRFYYVNVEGFGRPRPAVGISAPDTTRWGFIGAQARVAGFQVGFDLRGATRADIEPKVIIENNDIGILLENGGGQFFRNVIRNNGIGLSACGTYLVNFNSNVFTDNDLAIRWGLCFNETTGMAQSQNVEFNHNVLKGNTENFEIETALGVYSDDYADEPGCALQWMNTTVDGIKRPNFVSDGCTPIN